MGSTINDITYPALAELKNVVIALNPSSSYADMLAQFRLVEVALVHAKLERAAAENRLIPIASLPHEILSRIFEVHRDLHFDSKPRWDQDRIAPSIHISHVSTVWRDIALSTASLWKRIISSPHHTSNFYHAMIHRSRESLLEFTIRVGGTHDLPTATLLAELIPSQVHRLRMLRIRAPIDFIDSHVAALQKLSAPRMSELYLYRTIRGVDNGPPPPLQRIFTGGVQSLSRFEAYGFDPRIRPPLASVKVLALNCVNANGASLTHLALREAALTACSLTLYINRGALSNFRAIQMPSLQTLRIFAPFFEAVILLEMIEAPMLGHLCLYLPMLRQSMPQWHVHDSAFGKYPGLQFLSLQGELRSDILRAFPTIRSMRILDDPLSQPTELGDIFDFNQEAFSTLTPRLACIQAPEKFKESIQAFGAARKLLGLSVPQFIAASEM